MRHFLSVTKDGFTFWATKLDGRWIVVSDRPGGVTLTHTMAEYASAESYEKDFKRRQEIAMSQLDSAFERWGLPPLMPKVRLPKT